MLCDFHLLAYSLHILRVSGKIKRQTTRGRRISDKSSAPLPRTERCVAC
jgi:hypothetical protein